MGKLLFFTRPQRQWTRIKAKYQARVIVLRADKIHESPRNTGECFLLRCQFMRNFLRLCHSVA